MKTLSIKDIAAKANVSITTISFIINGKAREKSISHAVIKKVEQIIEECGYKPNQTARSLRTGSSNIIGLIVEDISNPFFAKIARLIEDKAYKTGYKIIYASTENKLEKAKDLLQMLQYRNVDAYIISPIKGLEKDLENLLKENKPVILFDRNLPGMAINYVGVNHFEISYKATQALIKQQKKDIAFITTTIDVQQIIERFEGYKKALLDSGLNFNQNLVLKIPFNQEENKTAQDIKHLLLNNKVDGALFATNYLAISGLKVLKQIDKPVDEQFDMIAYDDHEAFELHQPGISTIQQPLEEIAETVIKLLLSQLSSKSENKMQEIIIPAKLILRN